MNQETLTVDQWLAAERARGCTDASLIEALVQAGHAREDAQRRIAAFAPVVPVPRVAGPAPVQAIEASVRQPAGNTLVIDGQPVEVLLALAAPRVVLFGNLLSNEECDALVGAARSKITPSTIVDPRSGKFQTDKVRTSEGTYFSHGETMVVARIERRLQALLGHPIAQQEAMQILHYRVGAEYKAHYDWFDPAHPGSKVPMAIGGQRIATIVMYLNDVETGGATVFPNVGLEAKPRKGNAVYFESYAADGSLDKGTLHAGAPIIAGEKWIATKWIRERNVI